MMMSHTLTLGSKNWESTDVTELSLLIVTRSRVLVLQEIHCFVYWLTHTSRFPDCYDSTKQNFIPPYKKEEDTQRQISRAGTKTPSCCHKRSLWLTPRKHLCTDCGLQESMWNKRRILLRELSVVLTKN